MAKAQDTRSLFRDHLRFLIVAAFVMIESTGGFRVSHAPGTDVTFSNSFTYKSF
jgi:hypothetical protein